MKPTNPKDAIGISKPPTSTIPQNVIAEIGVGMLEGALKYGRHNYRVIGVRASVYYDAAKRHLDAWWEGEDIDPGSGLNHITKALTSLTVLRDATLIDKLTDDRPPKSGVVAHREELTKIVNEMFTKHNNPKEAYTELNKSDRFRDKVEGATGSDIITELLTGDEIVSEYNRFKNK